MVWILVFLGISFLSSVLVLAAGILSARSNQREDYVETYLNEAIDLTGMMPEEMEPQA